MITPLQERRGPEREIRDERGRVVMIVQAVYPVQDQRLNQLKHLELIALLAGRMDLADRFRDDFDQLKRELDAQSP